MRKGSLSFSTALAGMTAPRPDIGWTTVPLFPSGRSDWGKSLLPLKGESFRESFLQCTSLQVGPSPTCRDVRDLVAIGG